MTDWDGYLHCETCRSNKGEPCWSRSSGGPEALPAIPLEEPHRGRPLAGSTPRKAAPQSARKATATPVRRAAKKTASKVSGWQAVADKQRARRQGGKG